MTHGLWGHALFLASKMDDRSYSRVMLRFANGLDVNDPLQTLYQLMSGRLPIAVKVNLILLLKISLWTRKLSQIPSGQLFPFRLKSRAIRAVRSFKQSLRYHLYNAWFHCTFKWWQEKLLALDLRSYLSWTAIFNDSTHRFSLSKES